MNVPLVLVVCTVAVVVTLAWNPERTPLTPLGVLTLAAACTGALVSVLVLVGVR